MRTHPCLKEGENKAITVLTTLKCNHQGRVQNFPVHLSVEFLHADDKFSGTLATIVWKAQYCQGNCLRSQFTYFGLVKLSDQLLLSLMRRLQFMI